jgi:hypothetical protein
VAAVASLPVLQFGADADVPSWVVTVLQYGDVLAALLGIFIAYQAFRGYRRNDSRPMLFIAIGFVLALAVPFVLLLVTLAVPQAPVWIVGVLSQAAELLGLASIVYALWMPA